jgi:hypothetical protein
MVDFDRVRHAPNKAFFIVVETRRPEKLLTVLFRNFFDFLDIKK